jgi:hypothetical protein
MRMMFNGVLKVMMFDLQIAKVPINEFLHIFKMMINDEIINFLRYGFQFF